MNWLEQIKHITVNDMYKYTKQENIPLLSLGDNEFPFWADYVEHFAEYDMIFNRMFKGFYYFNQEEDEEVSPVTQAFRAEVNAMLRMNAKRYSELWRVHVISDENYSVIDNYDVTETKETEGNRDTTDNIGARITNSNLTTGAQENSGTNKVSPFDSEAFNNDSQYSQNIGSRSDTGSTTEQARVNTREETTGENYTLRRKGNIGTTTQSDVMKKHVDFWTSYDFYRMVFNDICKEMLLIEKAYI